MPWPILLCDSGRKTNLVAIKVSSSIHSRVCSSRNTPLALQTRVDDGGKAGSPPETELPLSGPCCSWREEVSAGVLGAKAVAAAAGAVAALPTASPCCPHASPAPKGSLVAFNHSCFQCRRLDVSWVSVIGIRGGCQGPCAPGCLAALQE